MTFTQFANIVAHMRIAQKRYFRTRAQGDLNESKRLEKAVDLAVGDALRQPGLFDRIEERDEASR